MCDDERLHSEMKTKNIACGEVQDMGWGVLTQLTLPGGGKLAFTSRAMPGRSSMK